MLWRLKFINLYSCNDILYICYQPIQIHLGILHSFLAMRTMAARHSETLEELVVYKATYQPEGENIWVRPLDMFNESLQVNGVLTKRFMKL